MSGRAILDGDEDMDSQDKAKIARRDVLRVLAAGAGAAAVGAAPHGADAAETPSDQKKARYRETEHVKAFYRVNRYPQK